MKIKTTGNQNNAIIFIDFKICFLQNATLITEDDIAC